MTHQDPPITLATCHAFELRGLPQHTPGPWRWELVPGKQALTLAVQVLHDTPAPAEFCKLVVVTPSYHPINALLQTAKADARLIAAAPEMWDLIVAGVNNLDFTSGDEELTAEEAEWRRKAVALIAKVRGTQ